MRIVGIDPGLATVGLGMVEKEGDTINNPQWLTIETKSSQPLPDRLREIAQDLESFLKETEPHLAVVERLFFAKNAKTAIEVAQARGIILLTLAQRKIKILEPTPPEVKSCITGYGKADKIQMQRMLVHLLNLPTLPKPDDAADALALAIYGAVQSKQNALHEALQ